MPPKRKASDEGDSSSSKVVQKLLSLHNPKQGRGRGQVRQEDSTEKSYEKFRKMKPPEFFGSSDPLIAMEWIKAVEAIFDYLKFEENDRVSCAVFLLTNAARTWWETTKVTVNIQTLKWQEFKDLFFDKYFSKDVKTKKVKEFLELKQGSMNVNDYILKFEEGCQFAPYISKDDTERGEHLLRSLRAEIKKDVRMSKATTYKEIVEKALMAEQV
ncbi:uncharacterized protein [Primulina eburnea]|uniref:uncharacterized protein n=1 Tax=Primulina eburnea TaxID=1245227 RepID=UPI003C6C3403